MRNWTLETTAYHEAGHVIAGLALGRTLSSALIREDGSGEVRWREGPVSERDRLISSVAGVEAEFQFLGSSPRAPKGGDLEAIEDILGRFWATSPRFEQARVLAARCLIENWPKVEKVASALLARGALDGDDVNCILGIASTSRATKRVSATILNDGLTPSDELDRHWEKVARECNWWGWGPPDPADLEDNSPSWRNAQGSGRASQPAFRAQAART